MSTSVISEIAPCEARRFLQDSDVYLGTRSAFDLVAVVKDRQVGEEFRRDRDAIAAYYKAG